jgi:hypothetical protein
MWELRLGLHTYANLIADARFQSSHPVKHRLGAEASRSSPLSARQIAVLSISAFRFAFPILMLWLWQFTCLLWQHNGPPLRYDAKSEIVHRRTNLLRAIPRGKGHRDYARNYGCGRPMSPNGARANPSLPKRSVEADFFCCLAAGFLPAIGQHLLLTGRCPGADVRSS